MNLLITLNFSPRPPVYPVTVNPIDLSASLSFSSSGTVIYGSQKLLSFKNTQQHAEFPVGISIFDETFDTLFYNETQKNGSSRALLSRNISGNAFYIDGNFSSDQSKNINLKGVYYPETQRGIMQGVFVTLFESAKITFNETQVLEYIKDPINVFPGNFYSQNDTLIDLGEKGDIRRKQCNVYLLFEYQTTIRDIKSAHYLPDNQIRHQWRVVGKNISQTQEEVPAIKYQLFSNDCSFLVEGNGIISNSAYTEWQGAIFFSVFLFLEFCLAYVAVTFVIKYSSPARIQSLSLPSVIFHLNSEYLCSILFIISTSQVPGLRNIAALLSMLGFVVLVPILLHSVLKIQIYANQFMQNFKKYLFVLLGLTFAMITPGLVLLLLAFFIPYIATLVCCLILSSYLFIAVIHKFIVADGKGCFPLYFTLVNLVVKGVLLVYCFGIENAFQFEFKTSWLIAIVTVLLVENILYLLQYLLGPRFGLFKAKVNQFDYSNQQFNQETIKLIQRQEFLEGLIPIPFTGESECSNPAHEHSVNFNLDIPDLYKYEQIGSLQSCNCFKLVHPNNLSITCQICLSDVEVLRSKNYYNILNIFGKKFKQAENDILKEFCQDSEEYDAWITPCGHIFHSDCLKSWLDENRVCPIDRIEIPTYMQ